MENGQPTVFGDYVLHERIGSGGMAEIFRATHRASQKGRQALVIKRILPALSGDAQFVKMFVEEARLCMSLRHPNVVGVRELGQVGEQYFIAMEYVAGRDLLKTLAACAKKRVPFPTDLALYIVMEVLTGLEYAHRLESPDGHRLGIIHRDVSPSNILLAFGGAVKLTDFGIAKASSREKTATGILKGKFGYMAPEQIVGHSIDHRADIFLVGILLYELLTGHRLFAGRSDLAILERVRDAIIDPPVRTYRPDLSSELEAIVLKSLARRPQDRFQSAAALHDSLADYTARSRVPLGATFLARFLTELFPQESRDESLRAEPPGVLPSEPASDEEGSTELLFSQESDSASLRSQPVVWEVAEPDAFEPHAFEPDEGDEPTVAASDSARLATAPQSTLVDEPPSAAYVSRHALALQGDESVTAHVIDPADRLESLPAVARTARSDTEATLLAAVRPIVAPNLRQEKLSPLRTPSAVESPWSVAERVLSARPLGAALEEPTSRGELIDRDASVTEALFEAAQADFEIAAIRETSADEIILTQDRTARGDLRGLLGEATSAQPAPRAPGDAAAIQTADLRPPQTSRKRSMAVPHEPRSESRDGSTFRGPLATASEPSRPPAPRPPPTPLVIVDAPKSDSGISVRFDETPAPGPRSPSRDDLALATGDGLVSDSFDLPALRAGAEASSQPRPSGASPVAKKSTAPPAAPIPPSAPPRPSAPGGIRYRKVVERIRPAGDGPRARPEGSSGRVPIATVTGLVAHPGSTPAEVPAPTPTQRPSASTLPPIHVHRPAPRVRRIAIAVSAAATLAVIAVVGVAVTRHLRRQGQSDPVAPPRATTPERGGDQGGMIEVRCGEPVEVQITGLEPLLNVTAASLRLPVGTYRVTLRKADTGQQTRIVDLEGGQTVRVECD